jgi:beta-aspartyl-peptidase (threonine type)
MTMRLCTAYSVVMYMRMGMALLDAGQRAIKDLEYLVDPYFGRVSIIAVDGHGNHGGFSNAPDATYVYMAEGMDACAEVPRIHAPTQPRP